MTYANETERKALKTERGWLFWFNARSGLWNAIQACALLVGGGWAIIILMNENHDRRIDLAMTHASDFAEGRTGDARRLLDELWYRNPAQLTELFREALYHLPNDAARREAIRDFVNDYILVGDEQVDPVEVHMAIADVAAQLDLVALCAGGGGSQSWLAESLFPARCNGKVVEQYFCGYANSFHTLYGGALDHVRRLTGNMSLGVASKEFAKGPGCTE